MKLKNDVEPIFSDDKYYDLFDGGYIKTEDFLEGDDEIAVDDAIDIITEFFELLESNGLIEEL